MSVNNLVNKALKRIGNVHPVIAQGAEQVIRRAYKQGLYIQFSDGYRSNAEQNRLYAQGRTTSGQIVTNARGGQSLHNYGLALDMFITNKAGTTASWDVSKLRQAAMIAKSLGFEWGGDWTSFKDYPHIQMTGGLSIAQLQAGRKPNISLKGGVSTPAPAKPSPSKPKSKWVTVTGSWTGQTLKKGHHGKPVTQLQKKMGIKADGYFGDDTYKAVRSTQSKAGITVDGLAGKATYQALTKKKSSTSNKPKASVTVDGKWGKSTTKALQKALGTPVDGIISKQPRNSVSQSLYSNTVQFGSGGSNVIVALQRKIKVNADGKLGPATIRALQRYLGTTQDGVLSRPSTATKELQRRLNAGTF